MSTSQAQTKTENGVLICPYLATSCPLLKPFAAAFSGHDDGSNSNSNNSNDGRPSPSACASAHASPNTQAAPQQQQQQQQPTYDAFGGPSVPIHSLHGGPSSGFDNQGSYRQQMQQQQQEQQDRGRTSPTLDGNNGNNFPSASYSRPVLNSNDSTATSISTLSATSSAQNQRQHGSLSPSRDYNNLASNNLASSSSTPYSTTLIHGNEPPTPNSFLRSPPVTQQVLTHLQQPVFPHHQQEQQRQQQQQQQQQGRYDPSEDPYANFTSSANYVDGRDYSNGGVGPYSGGGGPYGTFNTEDIEDISFNRQPQPAPQTFQPMQIPEPEERKVFASLEEVHESNGQQKEEVVGEQTAFISKLWHLLSHPEYARYLKWSKDGQAFILTNSNEFAIKVLPRFFRHSNVASFVRQLNLYSFQRVSTIRLLDMADSSTSTSINPSHGPGPHPPMPTPHPQHSFGGPESDSEDHHSSHSGGSPGPSNGNGTTDSTVTASGFTHPHFQRDHPELLKLLKPRGSTRKQASSSVASKKAAAAVRDEEDRRAGGGGGAKRAGSSSGGKRK
ncbi:HSF-type DNA-binding-domain-containing protein [Mrakia frigida]|uniref:heat shock factor family protein n=1 Tax=Mrakia frigida TaxID=29902 RepID=UPI003FCC194E